MTMPTNKEKSRQVELVISDLLRTGVVLSLAVVVIGTVLSFLHHRSYLSSDTDLRSITEHSAVFPHTMGDALLSIQRGEGRGIVIMGLLLLVATPVMRVAVSILGFVYEKDWVFVLITSTVLALLLLSFVLGRGRGE
jgi:uncharacterized membrane protein